MRRIYLLAAFELKFMTKQSSKYWSRGIRGQWFAES